MDNDLMTAFGAKELEILLKQFTLQKKYREIEKILGVEQQDVLHRLFREIYSKGLSDGKTAPPSSAKGEGTSAGHAVDSSASTLRESNIRKSVQQVVEQIRTGNFRLPVFPDVAQKILKLIDDPFLTIKKISQELGYDPSLTARIINIANSAIYGGAKEITSIDEAIAKIGLDEVKNQLYFISTMEVYNTKDCHFVHYLKKLANHSTAAGRLALRLAQMRSMRKPDHCLLMALFHDVGKLWIIQVFSQILGQEKKYDREEADQTICQLFEMLHTKMGSFILSKWNFEPHICEATKNHHATIDSTNEGMLVTQFANQMSKKLGYEVERPCNVAELDNVIKALQIPKNLIQKLETDLSDFMKNHLWT